MTTKKVERLLTEKDAADYLNFSPRTLAGWRYRGGGPAFISVSATAVRYRLSDLDDWIQSRCRTSTSEAGKRG